MEIVVADFGLARILEGEVRVLSKLCNFARRFLSFSLSFVT
jgi:hypothetical protein